MAEASSGESLGNGFVIRMRARVAQERVPLSSNSSSSSSSSASLVCSRAQALRCDACLDDASNEMVKLPCTHQMCKDCIVQLFTHALEDVSLLPVRCCRQEVTLRSVASILPRSLHQALERKITELKAKDKMYCPMPKCSAFISLDNVSSLSSHICCPGCGASLCTRCRRKWHPGKGCVKRGNSSQNDTQVSMQVMRVARAQGWRQCPGCKTLVELKAGCNHMTCRCHCQFCYKCGRVWKTCNCAIFDVDSSMPDLESDYETALREQEAEFHRAEFDIGSVGLEIDQYEFGSQSQGCRVHRFQKRNVEFNLLAGKWQDCSSCGHFLKNATFSCQRCNFNVCQECYYSKF